MALKYLEWVKYFLKHCRFLSAILGFLEVDNWQMRVAVTMGCHDKSRLGEVWVSVQLVTGSIVEKRIGDRWILLLTQWFQGQLDSCFVHSLANILESLQYLKVNSIVTQNKSGKLGNSIARQDWIKMITRVLSRYFLVPRRFIIFPQVSLKFVLKGMNTVRSEFCK